MRVRLNDAVRSNPSSLASIPILGGAGINRTIPLSAVASLPVVPGESAITLRENQQRYIALNGNVEGRDLGSVIKDIQKKLAQTHGPRGVVVELAGTYESQQKAFAQLLSIMGLGAVLVYFVLVVQFRSFFQPFIIFTAVSLSLFGVALALWLTKTPLNVSSFMGVILLVGLVVKNGIILIDFTNKLMVSGLDVDQAL